MKFNRSGQESKEESIFLKIPPREKYFAVFMIFLQCGLFHAYFCIFQFHNFHAMYCIEISKLLK